MRFEVSIFIEDSWRGPSRQDGVAMWLLECKRNGEPCTRQGFIHVEEGTQAQGNLMALVNAFFKLRKPCSIRVFTPCGHILGTMQNCRHAAWQENGWNNAKGRPVRNKELWEMLVEKMGGHACTFHGGHHEYRNYMQSEIEKEMARWKTKKNSTSAPAIPSGGSRGQG